MKFNIVCIFTVKPFHCFEYRHRMLCKLQVYSFILLKILPIFRLTISSFCSFITIIPFPVICIFQGVSCPTVITLNLIFQNWFSIKDFYSHFALFKLIANNFFWEIVEGQSIKIYYK